MNTEPNQPKSPLILIRQSGYDGKILNLLLAISSFSQGKYRACIAERDRLAHECNCTPAYVSKMLKRLAADNAIHLKATGRANHITLNLTELQRRADSRAPFVSRYANNVPPTCSSDVNKESQMLPTVHIRSEQDCTSDVNNSLGQMLTTEHHTMHLLSNNNASNYSSITDTRPTNDFEYEVLSSSEKPTPTPKTQTPIRPITSDMIALVPRIEKLINKWNSTAGVEQFAPSYKKWKEGIVPSDGLFSEMFKFVQVEGWEETWECVLSAYRKSAWLRKGGDTGQVKRIHWVFGKDGGNMAKVLSGEVGDGVDITGPQSHNEYGTMIAQAAASGMNVSRWEVIQ